MAIDFNNPELVELVRNVARSTSSNYPSYVSRDDVEQDLWEWILKKRESVSRLMRRSEEWEAQLRTTLAKVAHGAAQREDAAVNGYSPDDAYDYSIPVIRTLLPDVFDHENWQSFQTFGDGQPRAKGQANQTGDRLAMLADVKSAVERLEDENQYNIILWHFKYGVTIKALAAENQVTPEAIRQRVMRALGAVQRLLGRKSLTDMQNHHNGRRAIGLAQAHATTERDYEG